MPLREPPIKTFIWAHRGASGHEIDNTLESFDLALEMGADGIESDVHITADSRLILFHDDAIPFYGTMTDPSQLTLEMIRSIDLGNGRRVPLVSEVFTRYRERRSAAGHPVTFSLDLKKITMGDTLIAEAAEYGMTERVEITAQENDPGFWHCTRHFRSLSETILLVNSAGQDPADRIRKRIHRHSYRQNWARMRKDRFRAVNLRARYASDQRIAEIRRHGLLCYVWDCHDRRSMEKFLKKEVDAVYTNFPDTAVALRSRIQGTSI